MSYFQDDERTSRSKPVGSSSDPVVSTLAEIWNDRAREDARHYIKCDLSKPSPESFDESGEADVTSYVDPWLEQVLSRDRALDIGCGIGRLTRPLARRFGAVDGVDISPEMIERADSMGSEVNRGAQFHVVGGDGNLPFADDTFDLVFSYIVLQHLPTLTLVERYVRESVRVARPGGLVVLQLNTRRRSLHERLKVRVVSSDRVPLLHKKLQVRLDPHDFMGVTLTEAQCRQTAELAGAEILHLGPLGEQYTWMTLRPPQRPGQ